MNFRIAAVLAVALGLATVAAAKAMIPIPMCSPDAPVCEPGGPY
jgi:hypothetical protein